MDDDEGIVISSKFLSQWLESQKVVFLLQVTFQRGSFTWNRAKSWAEWGLRWGRSVLGVGLRERGNNYRLLQLPLKKESCSLSLS